MAGLSTSVGLISGIDIAGTVDALISLQRAPAVGNQITGSRLMAGLNSVLLKNLRGGRAST